MALVVGENTWTTVVEADAYLTNKVGTISWFDLPEAITDPGDPSKESYLEMAFNMLVSHPSYCLDPTLTDTSVKKAQTELAFFFVDNYDAYLEEINIAASGVKGFTLSKWKEDFFESWKGSFPLPATVAMFLGSYRGDNLLVLPEVE